MGGRRYLISISLLFSFWFYTSGQSQHYFGISYSPSKFIRHSDKSTFESPSLSYFWKSNYSHKVSGAEGWHRYWKRPTIGYNALFFDIGDDRVLGNAFGVFPSMSFDIFTLQHTSFYFHFGTGLAYLTKKYDKLTNPTNNAIGSHLNNITHLGFAIHQLLYKNLYVTLGSHLTHFSNARTSSPNTGINLVGCTLGLAQKLDVKPRNMNQKFDSKIDTSSAKTRWGGDFLVGYGISEAADIGGPKYGTYFVNIGGSFALSPYWKVIIGGEYEYNQGVFQFLYQDFIPFDEAKQKATNTAAYLATDLIFGKLAFRVQTGYYLPFPALSEINSPFYFKINFNVYPFPSHCSVRPYVGVLLKSHLEVAQHMGIVSGVSF
jgi:Lipid A 3-O-deacylase (PagL)